MAGRKRKPGPRNRDGRLKNQPRTGKALAENMRDAMRHTLDFRCKVMGWPLSRWNDARDARLATLHGRLYVAGRLTEREYLGLSSYAVRRHRWLRSIEAPSPYPKCATLESEPPQAHEDQPLGHPGGPLPEDPEEYAARVARDWSSCDAVLRKLKPGCKAVVHDVLEADETVRPHEVPLLLLVRLKWTARKLARHFGHN